VPDDEVFFDEVPDDEVLEEFEELVAESPEPELPDAAAPSLVLEPLSDSDELPERESVR
jgi:hypothetical protein